MKGLWLSLWTVVLSLLFFSCELEGGKAGKALASGENQLYVVSWNVQTFFDAQTSGLEYAEFRGSKSIWSQQLYEHRLERLLDAIQQIDADILVLQEIENMAVMYDISNGLAGRLRGSDAYGWMCFEVEEGSAIGCGVFSRFPLGQKRVHQLDCRTNGDQPQLRPLLEVEVLLEEGENPQAMNLFVCHWKSKSGGEEEAAFWQARQEALLDWQLRRVLTDSSETDRAIVCGDFNRELGEFTALKQASGKVLLGSVEADSGWLHQNTTSAGSYWYQQQWERIDHVFTVGNLEILHFEALSNGPWVQLDESGNLIPFRYALWKDEGYSDHLPVACMISY